MSDEGQQILYQLLELDRLWFCSYTHYKDGYTQHHALWLF